MTKAGQSPHPPAQGVRIAWRDLPAAVRARVEQALGSPVVDSVSQPGGFSPGVAARLRLADGRRAFVKAVAPVPNPDAPAFHRREAAIVAALPAGLPVPRLLWHEDGTQTDERGWVVLVFEDVAGHNPPLPWDRQDLDRVLEGIAELSQRLTPSPIAGQPARSAPELFARSICGWRYLAEAGTDLIDQLDPWSRRHLDQLAEIEAAVPDAVAGDTLLHNDIRADNVLLTPDRVWFVDWPHATIGAAWVDSVLFAPSVTMQGGPPPETVLARHPAAAQADPAAIDATIAALAGFLTRHSLMPPPPGLPTLRPFQAAQAVVARRWLAERRGWV